MKDLNRHNVYMKCIEDVVVENNNIINIIFTNGTYAPFLINADKDLIKNKKYLVGKAYDSMECVEDEVYLHVNAPRVLGRAYLLGTVVN